MYKRTEIKTLRQAQKIYDDALQMKCEHLPYCMTERRIGEIGERLRGKNEPSKVLYVKTGKRVSSVISSRQAQIEFEQLLESTRIQNLGLTPGIDKRYYCETCGSRSGESHPNTGMCFICDADDWKLMDGVTER